MIALYTLGSCIFSRTSREAEKLLVVGVRTDANWAHQEGQAASRVRLAGVLASFFLGAVVGGRWSRAKTFPLGNHGHLQGLAWKSILSIIISHLEKWPCLFL